MNLFPDDKYKSQLLFRFCKNTFHRIHVLELELMRISSYTPNIKKCIFCNRDSVYKNLVYFRLCKNHIPNELYRLLYKKKGGKTKKAIVQQIIGKNGLEKKFGNPFERIAEDAFNKIYKELRKNPDTKTFFDSQLKDKAEDIIKQLVKQTKFYDSIYTDEKFIFDEFMFHIGIYMQLYSLIFSVLMDLPSDDFRQISIDNIFDVPITVQLHLKIDDEFLGDITYNKLKSYQGYVLKKDPLNCVNSYCTRNDVVYRCIHGECYVYTRLYNSDKKDPNGVQDFNKILIRDNENEKTYLSHIGKKGPQGILDVTKYKNLTPLYEVPFHLKLEFPKKYSRFPKGNKECIRILNGLWEPEIDNEKFINRATAFFGWQSFLIQLILNKVGFNTNVDQYNVFIDDDYNILIFGKCTKETEGRYFLNEYYHGDAFENAPPQRQQLYFKVFDDVFRKYIEK